MVTLLCWKSIKFTLKMASLSDFKLLTMNTQMTCLPWIFSWLLPLTGFSRLQVKTKRCVLWWWYEKVLIALAHILDSWIEIGQIGQPFHGEESSLCSTLLISITVLWISFYVNTTLPTQRDMVTREWSQCKKLLCWPSLAWLQCHWVQLQHHTYIQEHTLIRIIVFTSLEHLKVKSCECSGKFCTKVFPLNSFQAWRTSRKVQYRNGGTPKCVAFRASK